MNECKHKWKQYTGLNEIFEFCEICDKKKNEATKTLKEILLPSGTSFTPPPPKEDIEIDDILLPSYPFWMPTDLVVDEDEILRRVHETYRPM